MAGEPSAHWTLADINGAEDIKKIVDALRMAPVIRVPSSLLKQTCSVRGIKEDHVRALMQGMAREDMSLMEPISCIHIAGTRIYERRYEVQSGNHRFLSAMGIYSVVPIKTIPLKKEVYDRWKLEIALQLEFLQPRARPLTLTEEVDVVMEMEKGMLSEAVAGVVGECVPKVPVKLRELIKFSTGGTTDVRQIRAKLGEKKDSLLYSRENRHFRAARTLHYTGVTSIIRRWEQNDGFVMSKRMLRGIDDEHLTLQELKLVIEYADTKRLFAEKGFTFTNVDLYVNAAKESGLNLKPPKLVDN